MENKNVSGEEENLNNKQEINNVQEKNNNENFINQENTIILEENNISNESISIETKQFNEKEKNHIIKQVKIFYVLLYFNF